MNEIVKSAIKLCIFISLANLPFITISQLIGMDTFLDSFENPNFYLYLQDSVHSIESNIKEGTFIIFQKSSHPDFTVMERDTILLCKDDEGIVFHRVYHINCIGSVKRYHIMDNNKSLADKPIYENQIIGKVLSVVDTNLWNVISMKIWDLSIHNLNIRALYKSPDFPTSQ